MSDRNFKILAFAGSLRKNSINQGLLKAAQEVAPEGVDIEIYDLHDIPLYNDDLNPADPPEPVCDFKNRIKEADSVLIATPEYNYSIPGVLKNAIDWASRPLTDNALKQKPAAILGATGGISGTIRAQLALRQVLQPLETFVMLKPEFYLPKAGPLFDEQGNLQDEETRDRLRGMINALVLWSQRLEESSRPFHLEQPLPQAVVVH
jgi:chromate reductase